MVNFNNIPAVILAGGKGTRISEYSKNIPKPMVKIKGTPIIDYIIRFYKKFGVKKFYILTGYKSKIIENHFKKKKNINVIYSGQNSMTGGRLLFLKNKIEGNFFCTYGDGISNINLNRLYNLHLKKKKIATLTAVHPISRFGEVIFKKYSKDISKFYEKPNVRNDWINGGFFVFNTKIFNFINDKNTILESETLKKLSKINELQGHKHKSLWHCMDTIRDKEIIEREYLNKYLTWLKN